MHVSTGHFDTPNASKYLQQLCKHFAHKVSVEYDAEQGTVTLPFGEIHLRADANALHAKVRTDQPDLLPKGHSIIDSHLVRFAFREGFETMAWDTAPQHSTTG